MNSTSSKNENARSHPGQLLPRWPVVIWLCIALAAAGSMSAALYSQYTAVIQGIALQGTELQIKSIEVFRQRYSSEVTTKALKNGLEITHEYEDNPRAIPLPATLTKQLDRFIAEARPGAHVRLYSDYPFPWRAHVDRNDAFATAAIEALRADPEKPFYSFESFEGRPSLRYAIADRMSQSCVSCHNNHAQSPKRDWKVGDVRGVLEFIRPLDDQGPMAVLTAGGTFKKYLAVSSVALGLGLLVLGYYIRSLARSRAAADAARVIAQEALRETAALRYTLDQNTIVTITDATGRIIEVNDAFCRISGYSREELIGQDHRLINSGHHPKQFWAEMRQTFAKRPATGVTSAQTQDRPAVANSSHDPADMWHAEVCNRAKDGSLFWVDTTITAFRGANGRIEKFVTIRIDITERKRIEAALALQTEELLHFIEHASVGMHRTGPDGCIQWANQTELDLLGYSREEYIGRPIADFHADPSTHLEIWGSLQRYGKVRDHAARLRCKDGSIKDVLISSSIYRKEGNFCYTRCFTHDITDRLQANNRIVEGAKLDSLAAEIGFLIAGSDSVREGLQRCAESMVQHLDAAFVRIWTIDPNEDILCLQASAGMYTHIDGAHARVPVGKFKIGLIAAERKPHLTNHVIGDPRVGDQEWAKREGMVAFAGYPLQIGENLMGVMALFARRPLSDAILKSLSTVANHVALDLQRRRAEAELAARLRQQEVLAELGRCSLSCRDQQSLMQAAVELVAETLDVELCKILELMPQGDQLLLRAGVGWKEGLVGQATVNSGCDSQAGYTLIAEGPVVVDRLDSETRFTGPPLLFEHGVVSGLSVVIMGIGGWPFGVLGAHSTRLRRFTESDVNFVQAIAHVLATTLQRDRGDELARQRNTLRDTLKAHEQLLGVVGHELRTPLAGLRAMSEFLLDEGARETAEFDQFLKGIHEETLRMAQTVNDLLEVARLNSGMARWQWASFRIADVCRDAADTVRRMVDGATVSLEAIVEPQDIPMQGDEGAVRRLLVNLLENARKNTPAGEIHLTAREVPDTNGRWIELVVQDTGTGMTPEVAARLGEAFALNSGVIGETHVKGSGLGLAICQGIVAAHGGRVSIESAPGRGTSVIVRLRADLTTPADVDQAAKIVTKVTS